MTGFLFSVIPLAARVRAGGGPRGVESVVVALRLED